MKVYISNYRSDWISPYSIVEWIFFWTKWSDVLGNNNNYTPMPPWAESLAKKLNWLSTSLSYIKRKIHPRITYVKIDKWDTWSMDTTLAMIIVPMLQQLISSQYGYFTVDDEDVPESLRSTNAPPFDEDSEDSTAEKRWKWVLGEMLFAFTRPDCWESDYISGLDSDWLSNLDDNGADKPFFMLSDIIPWIGKQREYQPVSTYSGDPFRNIVSDQVAISLIRDRISNGYRLFGKYYQSLWE